MLSTACCSVACVWGSCQPLRWQWTGCPCRWGPQAKHSVRWWQLGTGRLLRCRQWCRRRWTAYPAWISPLSRWSPSIVSLMDVVGCSSKAAAWVKEQCQRKSSPQFLADKTNLNSPKNSVGKKKHRLILDSITSQRRCYLMNKRALTNKLLCV